MQFITFNTLPEGAQGIYTHNIEHLIRYDNLLAIDITSLFDRVLDVSLLGLFLSFFNDFLVNWPIKSWSRWGAVWTFLCVWEI